MSDTVPMLLRELHQELGATWLTINGCEVVGAYGPVATEHAVLRTTAGVLDLSFRSRLCLTGNDRVRFLHGQVTNDVKRLRVGEGCYSALTTAKGKFQSDLNIYCLQDELLLDFEPGFTKIVTERIEKYIVADDVQVVDVGPHYGLLSVQGPRAAAVLQTGNLFAEIPNQCLKVAKTVDPNLGEIYLVNHARLGSAGFDVFVPNAALGVVAERLWGAVKSVAGCGCGWEAFEIARVEAGIPRFGADMDETNIPIECGIEARAISYQKGCYIGQEVLNRIHSVGHVNRELRGIRLAEGSRLPVRGDKLFHAGKEVGQVTSAVFSPQLNCGIALGYVRREANAIGTELTVQTGTRENPAQIVALPFVGS